MKRVEDLIRPVGRKSISWGHTESFAVSLDLSESHA